MRYFSYHAIAKNLIKNGKLIRWEIVNGYNKISPAMLLYFDDIRHPIMPIRQKRFAEYLEIIKRSPPPEKDNDDKSL